VTLGQELEMIENYFRLLYYRYEQRIRLEIDVPKNFYHYQVLKLMIQPIVENAVIHGLKPKQGKGTVKISVSVKDNILHIDVIDDGVGMSTQRLQEVIANMNRDQQEDNIGLNNVKNRIELTYGFAFGIEINSKENRGTLMSLRIPVKEGIQA
jgi:two-component system sensor histidine kinase YesM